MSNAIFSNSNYTDHLLPDVMEKILVDLNGCLESTKRITEKSPNANFQQGLDCLTDMFEKVDKVVLRLMPKQILNCR